MKNGKLGFAKTKLVKLSVLALLTVCVVFVSCGGKNSANATPTQDNSKNGEATIAISENLVSEQPSNKDGIDVDLTQLSSTMVYAEVFNMLVSPESYEGKTIKMRGNFNYYQAMTVEGKMMDRLFYACSIADATACCAQGLEFELAGNKKFPDEYPPRGSEITVVGTFEIYKDKKYGFTSSRIKDAKLI